MKNSVTAALFIFSISFSSFSAFASDYVPGSKNAAISEKIKELEGQIEMEVIFTVKKVSFEQAKSILLGHYPSLNDSDIVQNVSTPIFEHLPPVRTLKFRMLRKDYDWKIAKEIARTEFGGIGEGVPADRISNGYGN